MSRVEEIKEILKLMKEANLTEINVGDIHLVRSEVQHPTPDNDVSNKQTMSETEIRDRIEEDYYDTLFAHLPMYSRFIDKK